MPQHPEIPFTSTREPLKSPPTRSEDDEECFLTLRRSYVVTYTPMIPVVSLVLAVLTILASSHLNLKIALKVSGSTDA